MFKLRDFCRNQKVVGSATPTQQLSKLIIPAFLMKYEYK